MKVMHNTHTKISLILVNIQLLKVDEKWCWAKITQRWSDFAQQKLADKKVALFRRHIWTSKIDGNPLQRYLDIRKTFQNCIVVNENRRNRIFDR